MHQRKTISERDVNSPPQQAPVCFSQSTQHRRARCKLLFFRKPRVARACWTARIRARTHIHEGGCCISATTRASWGADAPAQPGGSCMSAIVGDRCINATGGGQMHQRSRGGISRLQVDEQFSKNVPTVPPHSGIFAAPWPRTFWMGLAPNLARNGQKAIRRQSCKTLPDEGKHHQHVYASKRLFRPVDLHAFAVTLGALQNQIAHLDRAKLDRGRSIMLSQMRFADALQVPRCECQRLAARYKADEA